MMHDLYNQIDNAGFLHAASLATVGGALAGWLPPVATALACVYYVVKICESETAKRLLAWVKSKLSN